MKLLAGAALLLLTACSVTNSSESTPAPGAAGAAPVATAGAAGAGAGYGTSVGGAGGSVGGGAGSTTGGAGGSSPGGAAGGGSSAAGAAGAPAVGGAAGAPVGGAPALGDECDFTDDCRQEYGPQATDCVDSASETSLCQCGPAPCWSLTPGPSQPGVQRRSYTPDDTTDFLNPERGWMQRGGADVVARARGGDGDHAVGYSVVWTPVVDPFRDGQGNPFRLDNYREQDLPQVLLDAVQQAFTDARAAGIKLKVRFVYNYSSGTDDTTREWMLRHISQLGPVLSGNADTIASLDTGLIGAWGEMHSSTRLVDSTNPWWQEPWISARVDVVNAWLDATPSWLNIGVRKPFHVRELYGESEVNGVGYRMDLGERFSGSDQSRVGWYNDCLWSNRSNTGTYDHWVSEARFDLDRDTFETVGRFAATSGESCDTGDGLNEYNTCAAVLADMERIGGPDTLFRQYWTDMYERWIDEGCYDEISRRLGYRLQLVSATLPTSVAAGEPMDVSLEIRNAGFGKVYNPRAVELVLVGSDASYTVRLADDARRDLPLAGETRTATYTVNAPDDLPPGEYTVHLRLPDPSVRLASDVRYALRLANVDLWDSATGRHDLGATLTAR